VRLYKPHKGVRLQKERYFCVECTNGEHKLGDEVSVFVECISLSPVSVCFEKHAETFFRIYFETIFAVSL